jgi:anaerobic selenocysteine-containing dehydrogenase
VNTERSICRVCANICSVRVDIHDGRIVGVHGDPDNPLYRGYSCVKGRNHALYDHPERVRHSLKRNADGELVPIATIDALAEIGDRLRGLIDRYGPRSVALYTGTYWFLDGAVNLPISSAFMKAIDSPMLFTPSTIDQGGKFVARGFLGSWLAPARTHEPDAVLVVGNNPLVSHQGHLGHPGDLAKGLRSRGGTLIVVDPRRTETAKQARIHLQARPGQDAAVVAGMLRVILEERLYDVEFVADNVDGLEQLRATVAPFTPTHVAAHADVDEVDLIAAARAFGASRRGYAVAGTGANMYGEGTLVEYLLQCLDTICGHWMREGEQVVNALSLIPAAAQLHKAQAVPPFASYGVGEPMRALGLTGSIAGLPTSILPDEILLPGAGQIRALISLGGNPATALPDQLHTIDALRSLDLLVQSDPHLSATAQLADYVIAPMLPYEVPGTTFLADFGSMVTGFGFAASYAAYTSAIVEPPEGSDVIEHWEVLYRLAQRMGVQLEISPGLGDLLPDVGAPTPLDMTTRPTTDELLELTTAGSRIPLAEVKRHPGGTFFPAPEVWVEPKDPGWTARLDVGNGEMMADLAALGARSGDLADEEFPLRLISRRMMHIHNSPTPAMPANRPRYNPAFLHPSDLERLELSPGDVVRITSRRASIPAIVAADATLRESLVSMTHGFGGGPERDDDVLLLGSTPARLSTNDQVFDRYSGQPRMSNIPVRIERMTSRPPAPTAGG